MGVLATPSPQAFDPYRQAVARPRDRPHLPARYVVAGKVHPCGRKQVIEEALRLHIGEMETQTHVRAAAKRHPRISVTRADSLVCKAQRIESERFRPYVGHAVREERVDANACA